MLILPIFHLRSYPELDEEAAAELEKYKATLVKYFGDQGKSSVFFERNFKSKHMQLQVVPIPKTDPEKLKQLFLARAEESQLKLTEIPSRSDIRQVWNTTLFSSKSSSKIRQTKIFYAQGFFFDLKKILKNIPKKKKILKIFLKNFKFLKNPKHFLEKIKIFLKNPKHFLEKIKTFQTILKNISKNPKYFSKKIKRIFLKFKILFSKIQNFVF